MSYAPLPIGEEDLHAFVDNEVDDDRREAILAYLSHTPADATKVEAWRQQNILLRAAFSQVALEQVPVSLSFSFAPRLVSLSSFVPNGGSATRQAYSKRLQKRSLVFTAAAFIAGICITLAASLSLGHYAAQLATIPMMSHGPGLAILAASDPHPSSQTLNVPQALLNRPGAVEPALALLPIFKAEGLQLLRGEVRGLPDNPADCLDFADAAGTPVVLCVTVAKLPASTEFQSLTAFATNAVYWREAASIYALAAPLENAQLMAIAKHVHANLTGRLPRSERP